MVTTLLPFDDEIKAQQCGVTPRVSKLGKASAKTSLFGKLVSFYQHAIELRQQRSQTHKIDS